MKPTLLTAAVLAGTLSLPLAAQTYRTTVETRRVPGPLRVDLTFAVGELTVRPGNHDHNYRLALTYAEDLFEPSTSFDPDRGRLTVKLEGEDVHLHGDLEASEQLLDLALPRNAPLDLELTFGAIEADVELGDLTLRSAHVKTGASETTVSFARPTRGSCDRIEFSVGAAEFEALQLGNSGCRRVSLEGAIGEMRLDFTGARWDGQMQLDVQVGLGEVRITVPDDVAIRMDARRFLASVKQSGLVRHGSYLQSPDYDRADTKLVIDLQAALGSVVIERVR